MTFAEFQATRVWSDDLAKDAPSYPVDDTPLAGLVYHGELCIEQVPQDSVGRSKGEWYLLLCNVDEISDDLADLERKLYDFAVSEQIVTADGEQS